MEKQCKRPLLLFGNSILFILSVIYIFSQIINFNSPIILGAFIFIFFFSFYGLKSVNMSKKEFKKGKWFTWVAIILFFLYDIFEYIILIREYNSTGYINILKVAVLFITLFAMLLSTLGILTRVIDNKITYEEHIKKHSNN
jgi:hypothetical protein